MILIREKLDRTRSCWWCSKGSVEMKIVKLRSIISDLKTCSLKKKLWPKCANKLNKNKLQKSKSNRYKKITLNPRKNVFNQKSQNLPSPLSRTQKWSMPFWTPHFSTRSKENFQKWIQKYTSQVWAVAVLRSTVNSYSQKLVWVSSGNKYISTQWWNSIFTITQCDRGPQFRPRK